MSDIARKNKPHAANITGGDDAEAVAAATAADRMYKMLGESIGKRAAAKSCGLFRADDWQCGKCRNVNWARRSLCNVCNAPKFVEIERRTGVGGGYNEREEAVEYVRRDRGGGLVGNGRDGDAEEEDEEEYDEYGRRKRRKKWKYESRSDEKEIVEDDESEDEGVDLSKYDLSNFENVEGDKNEIPLEKSIKR